MKFSRKLGLEGILLIYMVGAVYFVPTITFAGKPAGGTPDPCSIESLMKSSPESPGNPASKLFPIIPDNLLPTPTYNEKTKSYEYKADECPPSLWGLDVARFFLYKLLAFGQWMALALAIILTVYSGVLYISGFASEANVKKAKTVLIATYMGLIIVILARVIMYGSIQLLLSDSYDPYSVPSIPSK